MTIARSASRALLATLAVLAASPCACTLTHPLDEYHAGLGADGDASAASDSAHPTDAGDAATGPAEDAGDGCEGMPQILTPVTGSTVGASFHLTASAPRCLTTMILYVDGSVTLHLTSSAVDQDVPIAVGTHRLNINGWAGTAHAHESSAVTITRTK